MKLYTMIVGLMMQLGVIHASVYDPFAVEVDEPPTPKKASYFRGHKSERTEQIITRNLAFLLKDIGETPISSRDTFNIPHTNEGDLIYELTQHFPNCQDNPEWWVIYNATSSYIIANADPLLQASINEYIYKSRNRQPRNLQVSATYIQLDNQVDLDLASIRNSNYEKLLNFSISSRSGKDFLFQQNNHGVHINSILSPDGTNAELDLTIYHQDVFETRLNCTIKAGTTEIINLGISNEKERRVLLLTTKCLNISGRDVSVSPPNQRSKYRLERKFIKDREYLFYSLLDLEKLLNCKTNGLVANPDLPFFHKDAVTYDFKDEMTDIGIPLSNEEWTIYAPQSGVFVATGSDTTLDVIEEFFDSLLTSDRHFITTTTHFYEVNSRENIKEWDGLDLLSSDPLLLGNVGYLQNSGTVTHNSLHGNASMTLGLRHTGLHTDQTYQLDLKLGGREIKSNIEIKVPYNKQQFIEIPLNHESKRTVIMMIFTEKKRVLP